MISTIFRKIPFLPLAACYSQIRPSFPSSFSPRIDAAESSPIMDALNKFLKKISEYPFSEIESL